MDIRPSGLRFTTLPAPRRRTDRIVVHHTAGNPRQSLPSLHEGHRQRGWIGLGYNLVQDAEGVWYEGRGIDKVGAHAKHHNEDSIGVCLIGNFESDPLPAHRYQSLVEMCAWLCRRYRLPAKAVVGHRELAATLCPGKHLRLDALRLDVAVKLGERDEEPGGSPVYRVIVEGEQVGAYESPLLKVEQALEKWPAEIRLERIGPSPEPGRWPIPAEDA